MKEMQKKINDVATHNQHPLIYPTPFPLLEQGIRNEKYFTKKL